MKRKVFFRADGGAEIGLGHVVRSCALADMLKDDFECHFFIRNPAPDIQQLILRSCVGVHPLPNDVAYNDEAALWANTLSGEEIVVLDGYAFTTAYQQHIKHTGARLVCIDDIYATHFIADAVINHAPGLAPQNYSMEPYTGIFLGTSYILLRDSFLNAVTRRTERTEVTSLFICFGGSDFNNLTGKVLKAAVLSGKIKNINLVVGGAFQYVDELEADITKYSTGGNLQIKLYRNIPATTLAELIATSDLAVCPCSSILFEACAVGTGLISGFYIDNQRHIFDYLNRKGIFDGAGDFNAVDIAALAQKISNIDVTQINNQIKLQKEFIDGNSPRRLKKLFHKLNREYDIAGRKVIATDARVMFDWANDPETRANAIDPNPIPWEGHVQWFNKKISDANSYMFIFEHVNTEKSIGLTRFDLQNGAWLISYLVDKEHRGEGWGEVILKSGISMLMEALGQRPRLKAMVKEGNIASSQVFVNLGFITEEPVVIDNVIYKVYEK